MGTTSRHQHYLQTEEDKIWIADIIAGGEYLEVLFYGSIAKLLACIERNVNLEPQPSDLADEAVNHLLATFYSAPDTDPYGGYHPLGSHQVAAIDKLTSH